MKICVFYSENQDTAGVSGRSAVSARPDARCIGAGDRSLMCVS
jgi:hypothetical protein